MQKLHFFTKMPIFAAVFMTRQEFIYNEGFDFEAGGHIDSLKTVYHCSDKLWNKGDSRKVIWICHALTANSDPTQWWPDMVGLGKFLDPERYFIICANILTSAYGSSSPASPAPGSGQPYFLSFPPTTVRDMVRAMDLLRKHLGIESIDLLIGASIGGFQALEWSVMCPEVIKSAAYIACGARVSPWMTAFNESMRMALEADPSFGRCESLHDGRKGLECARSIALLSYRSYEGYTRSQKEADPDCIWASRACSYQRHQGEKLSARFDAYSYYYLCKAVDSHNLGRGRNGVEAALATIRAKSLVIGIDSDFIFPVEEQKYLAAHIPGASYRQISSLFGHDGFLLEYSQLTDILKPYLP